MSENILIVDDDIDTVRLVGLMLERQGYSILAANTGQQALERAKHDRPDLIVLDIMMPDLDGYEVTRRLREDPVTANIPIIMFTAKTQVDDKILGLEVGADDYLTKPTQPRELVAHIKAALLRLKKTSELTAQKPRGFMTGVLAAKGGLGVTTVVLNVGIAIRRITNKDIIVAEFRPGQGSISLALGLKNPEGLNRLIQQKPIEITAHDVEVELLDYLTGIRLLLSSFNPRDVQYEFASDAFNAIARQLPYLASYVLVDLGPGLSPLNGKVLNHCDQLIVITEPVPQTVIQTKILIQDLLSHGIGEGRIKVTLLNRLRTSLQLSWTQVQDQLGMNITSVITPAPELAYQAASQNIPIITQQPDGLTADQFYKLAEQVIQRSQ